jgi:hypothetical protein
MFIVCFQCSLIIVLIEYDEGVPSDSSFFFSSSVIELRASLEAKLSVSRHLLDCIDTLTQRNLLSLLAYSSTRTIERKC